MALKETTDTVTSQGTSTPVSAEDEAPAEDTLQRTPTVTSTATVDIINDKPISRPTMSAALGGTALGPRRRYYGRQNRSPSMVYMGRMGAHQLGAGILLLLELGASTVAWVFLNIPIGIGTAMLIPAMALSIQAAAFFSVMRTFGQAVGVAVSGVMFQNVFRQKLLGLPGFVAVSGKFSRETTIVAEIIKVMEPGAQRRGLVNAHNTYLRAIYVSTIAFAGFCLVLIPSVKGYSLQQEHMTKQGLVQQAQQPEESRGAELGAAKVWT